MRHEADFWASRAQSTDAARVGGGGRGGGRPPNSSPNPAQQGEAGGKARAAQPQGGGHSGKDEFAAL
eukprot:10597915-Alexandrium_andersonii.AAC.1